MLSQCFPLPDIKRLRWILSGYVLLWLALALGPALLPHSSWIGAVSVPLHLNSIRLCVALDILIFVVAWHAFDSQRRLDSVILALTFLIAAALDFAFLSRLPGMPALLPGTNPGAAMMFWILARWLTGIGVVLALCVPGHARLSLRASRLALALVILALVVSIGLISNGWLGLAGLHARRLPSAVGLASLTLALTAASLALVAARREQLRAVPHLSFTCMPPRRIEMLAASLALILSECSFGLGAGALPSLIGPSFKLIATLFFYRAVLSSNIQSPYAAMMSYAAQVMAARLTSRDNEQRLQHIIQHAGDAILVTDETQTIVLANPAAAAMFGTTLELMREQRMEKFIPPRHHKAFHCYIKNYARVRLSCSTIAGSEADYDVSGLRADGREFPLEASISAMLEGGAQFTILILRDITARRLADEKILRSHAELSRLSLGLQTLRERERREIARGLNDDLGQLLAAVRIDLSLIQKQALETIRVEPSRFDKMDELLITSISSLRRIATDLRPRGLDEGGLFVGLESLRKEFAARHGIDCELIAEERDLILDDARTTALYRIAQAALDNVQMHANATQVVIRVQRHADNLDMVIEDDGCGIQEEGLNEAAGFGLVDMRERVRSLEGSLAISGRPGRGTRIQLCIPLASLPE
jgi:PAS domain S-box-containing protein